MRVGSGKSHLRNGMVGRTAVVPATSDGLSRPVRTLVMLNMRMCPSRLRTTYLGSRACWVSVSARLHIRGLSRFRGVELIYPETSFPGWMTPVGRIT